MTLNPTTSLIDPGLPAPHTDGPATANDDLAGIPAAIEIQAAPLPFDERLRAATRRTPVTWALVAANVGLFSAMAATHQRVFYFSPDALLTWGGGLAPRVFDHEWWRAASYMFVHGDLAHLAGNLLFLLLIAPLVERLLGSARFALVYLLAGLGGGLLGMGTYPQHVAVGASAAVFGVYGSSTVAVCAGRHPDLMVGGRAARRSAVAVHRRQPAGPVAGLRAAPGRASRRLRVRLGLRSAVRPPAPTGCGTLDS